MDKYCIGANEFSEKLYQDYGRIGGFGREVFLNPIRYIKWTIRFKSVNSGGSL